MDFTIAVILTGVMGAVCSFLAVRFDQLARAALFRWGMPVLYIVMLVFMHSRAGKPSGLDAFVTLMMMAGASIFWGLCLAICVVQIIANVARAALSLDDIKVPPAYSKAEGVAVRGDLEEAIELYRRVAEENPEEPESFRRMAELYLRLQRADDAMQAFREAERREQDIENKLLLVFAISEVLSDVKADVPAGIETIERFVAQHPDLAGRSYAEQRIKALRERLGEGDERGPLR